MNPAQREHAIRTLLPTVKFQMMERIAPELLRTFSSDAQHLRRKLADGAIMIFICAGLQGKRFIFERAASLGVKCIVVDLPDSWSRVLVNEGIIEQFIPVDMSRDGAAVFRDV